MPWRSASTASSTLTKANPCPILTSSPSGYASINFFKFGYFYLFIKKTNKDWIFDVKVTSHYGNNYHYSELVESGQFAFVAAEAGDYMACFWAPDHKPQITLTIEFDWKTGVAAKDWSNVAKKGSVDVSLFLFLLLFFTFTSLFIYVFFST